MSHGNKLLGVQAGSASQIKETWAEKWRCAIARLAYSSIVNEVRGKMGTDVYSKSRSGPTARVKGSVHNPKTGAQRTVRGNLRSASKAYKNMSTSQAAEWQAYGETIIRHNPLTGGTYTSAGINAFVELATKFLQLNPTGTIPMTPPTTEFVGDTITVSAESETPGQIEFTATAPNASGVTTELLIQQLPSQNREPNPNGYKHAGWKAFASGGLTTTVNVTSGYYAVAYRFVKTATGQATDLIEIPLVTVGFSVAQGGNSSAKKAA